MPTNIKAQTNKIKYGSDWIKLLVTGAFQSVCDNPRNVAFSPEELKATVDEYMTHGRANFLPAIGRAHKSEL